MQTFVVVDWLSFTVPFSTVLNPSQLIYPVPTWYEYDKPHFGYKSAIVDRDGVTAMWNNDRPEMGVHVSYSGKALNWRRYAGTPAREILRWYASIGAKCTRLDVALDVHDSALEIMALYDLLGTSGVKTRCRKWSIIQGNTGTTLYVGDRGAERFLRIYDKAAEQSTPGDWIRLELELKQDAAKTFSALLAKMNDEDTAERIKALVRKHVDFDTPIWRAILSDVPAQGLAKEPKQSNTAKWLLESVAPAMGRHIDRYKNFDMLDQFIAEVRKVCGPNPPTSQVPQHKKAK